MLRLFPAVAAVVLAGGLSACAVPAMTASAEREADARALLEDLVNDRDDVLISKMAAGVKPADVRAQLPFMKSLVPDGPSLKAWSSAGARMRGRAGRPMSSPRPMTTRIGC